MGDIRGADIQIDLSALADNLQLARQLSPHSRLMPVIKANGYGHGMLRVAEALEPEADGFAVAQPGEALRLHRAGIRKPITVFQGFNSVQELQQLVEIDARPALTQLWQIDLLEQATISTPLDIWIKLNTGMGRLGLQPEDVDQALTRLDAIPTLNTPGLMTHFANADDPSHPSNQHQIDRFRALMSACSGSDLSLSNSAALMSGLCTNAAIQETWVRPGIMLYGASPLLGQSASSLGLKPVMSVTARLIAINHLKKGEFIGYGHRWQCPEDMPVGIVDIGYGDGYSRHARDGTPVMVNDQPSQLIGRVSMDSIMLDLRGIKARCGDRVELWGHQLAIDEVADACNTISYELLCNLGRAPA